ncbi:methionine--tRNA ligase [candidate division WOR-3 bacterium]|nr:methionine--tRNA ligase [candidate division WOR-3 bacterium]
MKHKRTLVTSALPYANGPLHIGHLAGCYLPADIFVRYLRSKGEDVIHICGTDEHGVQITLKAEQEKTTPKKLVDGYHEMIKKALNDVGIEYENFSRTTKKLHYERTQKFFLKLLENGFLEEKEITQLYCEKCGRFLPDRFVEGECPFCSSKGARGDQCEACGRWLEPSMLKNPRCKICSSEPAFRKTTHWFLRLDALTGKLKDWHSDHPEWKDNVTKFCKTWFDEGLIPRAITRDIDWGVPVPLEGSEGKVLYVWFDAPIGYISSTIEWAKDIRKDPGLWEKYWLDKDTRLVHFIGKDNIVFHAMVWPGMIMAHGDYILPDQIPANEFLNIEGEKVSTSRNWAVWVDQAVEAFPPDALRYVLAATAPENSDVDFTWSEFQRRVNDELADVLGNFVNRTLTFVNKYYAGKIPGLDESSFEKELTQEIRTAPQRIGALYESFQVKKAVNEFMKLARTGNKVFQSNEPWSLVKSDPEKCRYVIALCAAIIDTLASVIEPVLPFTSQKIFKMLRLEKRPWDESGDFRIPEGHELGNLEILFGKIDDEKIDNQRKMLGKERKMTEEKAQEKEKASISDLLKIGLKVGLVKSVQRVEKSDKLYKLTVDLGDEERQIVAGMVPYYPEEDILGKKVIVVSNLEPAKIRGVESNGMILAADDGKTVSLLTLDKDVAQGSNIR